jgi:hypothetical protein
MKYVNICDECGSANVEFEVWFDPNTGETGGDSGGQAYCNGCCDYTSLDTREARPEEIRSKLVIEIPLDRDIFAEDLAGEVRRILDDVCERGLDAIHDGCTWMRLGVVTAWLDEYLQPIDEAREEPAEGEE